MKLTLDANLFVARFREKDVAHQHALDFFEECERRSIQLKRLRRQRLFAASASRCIRVLGYPDRFLNPITWRGRARPAMVPLI
jgi:predicted nucleic acid-binding protein